MCTDSATELVQWPHTVIASSTYDRTQTLRDGGVCTTGSTVTGGSSSGSSGSSSGGSRAQSLVAGISTIKCMQRNVNVVVGNQNGT